MSLFTSPTVAELRAASNLTPAQFGPTVTTEQMEATMAQTIAAAVDFVTGQILSVTAGHTWPFETATVAVALPGISPADEVARQSRQATEAARLEALARLWEVAGQLNEATNEESDRQREAAGRELANLLASIARVASRQPATNPARRRLRSRVLTQKLRM